MIGDWPGIEEVRSRWETGRVDHIVFPRHVDGSAVDYDDFTCPFKTFWYKEWDPNRNIVPIHTVFTGDLKGLGNSLWWYGKDVRYCYEAFCSFFQNVSEIVGVEAQIIDIELALRAPNGVITRLGSVVGPDVVVEKSYAMFDSRRQAFTKHHSGNLETASTQWNLVIVTVAKE